MAFIIIIIIIIVDICYAPVSDRRRSWRMPLCPFFLPLITQSTITFTHDREIIPFKNVAHKKIMFLTCGVFLLCFVYLFHNKKSRIVFFFSDTTCTAHLYTLSRLYTYYSLSEFRIFKICQSKLVHFLQSCHSHDFQEKNHLKDQKGEIHLLFSESRFRPHIDSTRTLYSSNFLVR